jgi:ZIP family zinc transporter
VGNGVFLDALVFGIIASSALVLAFASGALMTALAFELFEDAYEHGGIWRAA